MANTGSKLRFFSHHWVGVLSGGQNVKRLFSKHNTAKAVDRHELELACHGIVAVGGRGRKSPSQA